MHTYLSIVPYWSTTISLFAFRFQVVGDESLYPTGEKASVELYTVEAMCQAKAASVEAMCQAFGPGAVFSRTT